MRILAIAILGCVFCGVAGAVEPVPAASRIPAKRVGATTMPTTLPMHMPTDAAADSKGRIFVADGARDRIVRFAADGSFDAVIGQIGAEKMRRPVGVTIDAKDRLWIADSGNHRVLLADLDGKLIEAIDLPAPEGESSHPANPTHVAVAADLKRAYVVDNANHRVLIRDLSTGAWTSMGKLGRALGQFQWPFMICIGERGYVYITEVIGARVQQISAADRWAGEFGAWGVEGGQFYRPKGIVADAKGRVYVSDSTVGVVQVFSPRGQWEGVLSGDDNRPMKFEHPMGLNFDPSGRLLVTELKANRVAIISLTPEGKR